MDTLMHILLMPMFVQKNREDGRGKGSVCLCLTFCKPICKYMCTDCYVHFKWSFTRDEDICLTRMGFGLNVAHAVMKDIVVTVLVKGESL